VQELVQNKSLCFNINMMTEENIKELKAKLEATKLDLETETKGLDEAPDFGSDVDSDDEEVEETEALGTNLGTRDILNRRLTNVMSALQKIEKGTYGTCEQCEKEIELKLLQVDPESRLCKACKLKQK